MLHKTNFNSIANATNYQKNDPYNLDALKERLKNNDAEALKVFELAGVSSELIAEYTPGKITRKTACPICGGTDRFHLKTAQDGRGVVAFCSDKDGKHRGNGQPVNIKPFDFFQAARGLDLNAAVCEIVKELDGPQRMPMRKNDVVIQAAPPITAKPSALSQSDHAPKTSKKGLRIVPETEARQETRDYIYTDENGAPVFNARRVDFYDKTTGERVAIDRDAETLEKSIFSLVPDGAGDWKTSKGLDRSTIPPYNLPKLKGPDCQWAYIPEGEKSAERLERALAGYNGERVATTTGATSNAGHWRQWAPRVLSGKGVFVLADHDAPGRKAAETIAEAVAPYVAGNVQIIDFETRPDGTPAPEGYDVADYLDDLERVDPSAIASNYLDALAVSFTPSALSPLQREKEAGNGLDAPPVDKIAEELDPIELRRIREAEQERRAVERETFLTLPPYPVDAIPRSLLEYAQFYAAKHNAPISTAVKQALANFSGLVARLFPMTAPAVGYTEKRPLRCNLSVLTIADSGAGKSPLFDALFEPIAELQNEIERRQARIIAEYKETLERQEAAKLDKKRVLSKFKRTDDPGKREKLEKQLDELDDLIFQKVEEPRRQQELYIDPETPEGSLECVEINLLNGYQNAPIIATDEGVSAFSATYNPRGTLAAFKKYSKLEDGSRFKTKLKTKEASGDNSNPAPRLAAFNICIQPEVLNECFHNDALRRQGFLNRFLIDEQTPDFNADIIDEPLEETTRNQFFIPFERAFQTCLYYDAKKGKAKNAEAGNDLDARQTPFMCSHTYRLVETVETPEDTSALDVFRAFRRYCREKQAKYYKQGNKTLVSFYSKLQKIVFKYAVLFRTWEAFERKEGAFVKLADSGFYLPAPTIDAAIMRRAVDVATWDGLKREAVGSLVDSLNPENTDGGAALPILAQRVLDMLAEEPEKLFSKTEIVGNVRNLKGKRNARKFKLIIKRLIDDGLIKEVKEKRGNNNPVLYQYVQLDEGTLDSDLLVDDAEEENEEEGGLE